MYVNKDDILKLKLLKNSKNESIINRIVDYFYSHLNFDENTNYIVFLPYELIIEANKILGKDIIDFGCVYDEMTKEDFKDIFNFLYELLGKRVDLLSNIDNFPALENELLNDIKKLKLLLGKLKVKTATPEERP